MRVISHATYAHDTCPTCPTVDDITSKMTSAIDWAELQRHGCAFVLVVANAEQTVVKSSGSA